MAENLNQASLAKFKVFGTIPKDTIYLPQIPFTLRNDCRIGIWKIGNEDYRGKEIEISIIKVNQLFGTLGKSTNTFWMQIWFVPAPSCEVIPSNIVYVSYLKGRSITQFSEKITQLMQSSVEPALGIFKAGFTKHTGEKGDYYSVVFDWRERASEAEFEQLNRIADLMATDPKLVDFSIDLLPIDNLSTEEIQMLITAANSEKIQLSQAK